MQCLSAGSNMQAATIIACMSPAPKCTGYMHGHQVVISYGTAPSAAMKPHLQTHTEWPATWRQAVQDLLLLQSSANEYVLHMGGCTDKVTDANPAEWRLQQAFADLQQTCFCCCWNGECSQRPSRPSNSFAVISTGHAAKRQTTS